MSYSKWLSREFQIKTERTIELVKFYSGEIYYKMKDKQETSAQSVVSYNIGETYYKTKEKFSSYEKYMPGIISDSDRLEELKELKRCGIKLKKYEKKELKELEKAIIH